MTSLISVVIISKNEPALGETLHRVRAQQVTATVDITVVDASDGRLDHIRDANPDVCWLPFYSVDPEKRVTIAEQRNVGVRASSGSLIVFTDSGCTPEDGWLDTLTRPILDGRESVTVGRTIGSGIGNVFIPLPAEAGYLEEAPTINLAFLRSAYDAVGGFDERFDYGSDIDFTWRLRDTGHRLLLVPDAVVTHDWGNTRRQFKRARQYGQARANLYLKHPKRVPGMWRRDPVLAVYPLYILLLPLTLRRRYRWLPLLLVLPWWYARGRQPTLTVIDHLIFGASALSFLARRAAAGLGHERRDR